MNHCVSGRPVHMEELIESHAQSDSHYAVKTRRLAARIMFDQKIQLR